MTLARRPQRPGKLYTRVRKAVLMERRAKCERRAGRDLRREHSVWDGLNDRWRDLEAAKALERDGYTDTGNASCIGFITACSTGDTSAAYTISLNESTNNFAKY